MANEKIVIEIDLDLNSKDVKKATKKIEKDLSKSGDKASKSFSTNFTKGLRSSLSSLSGFATTAVAGIAAAFAGREIINAAIRQEEAVQRVENSLRRIGEFSEETSKDLQDYASSLQAVTRIGDEAALEQLAFAQGLGASVEQSKQAVTAAADLAAALDIDLNSATRNVAKTLGGFAGELGEVIPELKNFSAEQLQAGAGIDLLAKKFAGFAQNEARGFGASLERLSNQFGDFLEALGGLVTQSDSGIGGLESLGVALDFYTRKLKGANQEKLTVGDLDKEIESLDKLIVKQRQLVESQSNLTGLGAGIRDLFGGAERAQEGLDELILKQLDFEKRRAAILEERSQQDSIRTAKEELERTTKAQKEKEALTRQLSELGIITQEQVEKNFRQRVELLERLNNEQVITDQEFNNQVLAADEEFEKKRTDITKKGAKDRNKASFDAGKALGNILAANTAQLASSLIEGQNASQAFGDFILNSFGSLASQLGQFYIATGVANKALFGLSSPTSQIAAGVALTALGSILGSFSSGGITSGAPSGAGITPETDFGAGSPVSDDTTNQIVEQELQAQNVTNISVEGLIGGRQLVDIINESAESEDIKLNVSLA